MIYFSTMTLGEYITIELDRRGWDIAKFARELNVSWQRAQRLAFDEPKRVDGSPPTVRPETLEKVAKVFKDDPKKVMDQIYLVEETGESNQNLVEEAHPKPLPSLQGLYEGLTPDDQDELIQIAVMKWRKSHPNATMPEWDPRLLPAPVEGREEPPEALQACPEETSDNLLLQVIFPGLKINAYTGEMFGPTGAVSEADDQEITRTAIHYLSQRHKKNLNEKVKENALSHLRQLLKIPELDEESYPITEENLRV